MTEMNVEGIEVPVIQLSCSESYSYYLYILTLHDMVCLLHHHTVPHCTALYLRGMVVSPDARLMHKTLPSGKSHIDYSTKHDGFHTVCFTQSPPQSVPTVRQGDQRSGREEGER